MILAVYPPEERRRVHGYAGAVLGGSLAFTLAAATGMMAALGPSSGMAVAGAVCLTAALVVQRSVPSRDASAAIAIPSDARYGDGRDRSHR
ncbi:hypothetical protein J2853_002042 [Streptosporangium lutulentum]|uniref:Major facilitator superfamily (MFS) profile domain-containing protein n=1 Tax=Streptosporangium lutulentum TaxID=1461250 RepID=A0ABT9Q7V6_9ACTN|nr:hypothetical protein [Streptosporangium lutulentum]